MNFVSYLEKTAKEIDEEVEEILKQQLETAGATDKKLIPLIKAFAKSCQGGKRIRGVLIKLGYQLAGGSGEITKIAAAYEICHAAILAHDDIMDKSLTRRDKPSLYQALGGDHYGISQAITLADYGFFLAFKIFANTPAAGLFSKIMMETALGQILELRKANPLLVMKLKTACYTIAGPLQIGAVLAGPPASLGEALRAGGNQQLIETLGTFGENLGIAYQIRDDILDGEVNSLENVEKYTKKALQTLPKDLKMGKLLEQLAEYLIERTK